MGRQLSEVDSQKVDGSDVDTIHTLDNATSVRDDATGKSFSIRCVQSNMLLQGLNRKPSYKRVFQSSSLEQKQESDCQQQSRLFDARLCMCLPPSHHPF